MDRQPLIVANWKMHGSKAMARELLERVKQGVEKCARAEVVVMPPYTYLLFAERLLSRSIVHLGAQNVGEKSSGAYTGEISVAMLIDVGCRYVLIGHSERRCFHGEDETLIATKLTSIAAMGGVISPILCIGETHQQRANQQTMAVLQRQLKVILEHPDADVLFQKHLVIAYEPLWAIGTGQAANSTQIQAVHQFIRQCLSDRGWQASNLTRIIYGGSVKASNAAAILALPDVDGVLVGAASLDPEQFISIAEIPDLCTIS